MYRTRKPETSLLSRAMVRLPAFSPIASARTRRNCRKPFLFMHLLHNLRTPPGWGRHPRASSPDFSLLNAIPFRIRSYEKTARNPFGIRTYETQHLKSFRIRTYKKNGGGGRVPMLNTPTPSGTATPVSLLPDFSVLLFTGHRSRNPSRVLYARLRERRSPRPGRSVSAPSFSVLRFLTFNLRPLALSPSKGQSFASPRTSTHPPPIYGIIPPRRRAARNSSRPQGGFSD